MNISYIALDFKGYPHIVYWQSASYSECGVRYTQKDDTGWHKDVVVDIDDACGLGGYTRLVLDNDDHPHISFGDYDQRAIIYGYRENGVWHLEPAATRSGSENALALSDEGRAHIAYYEIYDGDLHYTYHDGTDFQDQFIDSDINNENISMQLDVDGYPHISYQSSFMSSDGECLRYAHREDSGWKFESLDCVGADPGLGNSLFLDTSGAAHIELRWRAGFDVYLSRGEQLAEKRR